VVTVGSTWTWYYLPQGEHAHCEVLYPQAGKLFTSDAAGYGDAGKWKGSSTSTKLTFTSGFDQGATFKYTWDGNGYWDGNTLIGGVTVGPWLLVQGDDPLDWGGC
jgi:hypothetical protein